MVFDPSTNGNASRHGDVQDDQPGGKYGYRLGHRLGEYQIPDVVLNSPNQKIKVITIGAGISGILMSYLIQKHGENIQHVVYEKNGDIGGTWLEVRLLVAIQLDHADDLIEQISGLCVRCTFPCVCICFRLVSRLAKVLKSIRGHLPLPRPRC